MKKDHAAAAAAFADQVAAHPTGPLAADGRAMLGESLFQAGNYAEASAALAKALEDPGRLSSDDLRGLAAVRASEAAAMQEKWSDSLAFADRLVATQPRSAYAAQARYAAAWARQNLGRLDEALQAYRELADASRSRDVTVNGSWGRSRLSQDLPNSSDQLNAVNSFGIQLSVPIFTQRIVEGNVGVATAQAGQAEAQARATLLQARADFAAAWAGYEQSRALLNLFNGGALNRAEDAYRSTEQAYLAGGRSLIDVLDALRTLNATRIQANQARYAYLLALAQLELATGTSGIAPRL
jgi:outer membrane protein TolC